MSPDRRLEVRLLLLWLRAVSRLLPPASRADWREEWEAELLLGPGSGRLRPGRALDLAVGLLRDALDFRSSARAGTRAPVFDGLRRDLRQAWARLRRQPALALGVVATLALGVGTNAAIFVVADRVLVRPLPYPDAERLYAVWETGPQPSAARTRVSVPDFLDWRERRTAFEALAAWRDSSFNVEIGGEAARVDGQVVSANLFRVLGAVPVLGRDFEPREEHPGRELGVVLSHGFWKGRLGGDPGVLGRRLMVDGEPYAIAGVMPADLRFPGDAALWLPLGHYRGNLRIWRATHVLHVLGRLPEGVAPRAAASSLTALAQELWERAPIWRSWRVTLRPLREEVYGDFRLAAAFVWVAGLSLLAVMCANLANLFLARGVAQTTELAVRRALGAGTGTLLRQAGAEAGVLCVGAVLAGLLLAVALVERLAAGLPDGVAAVYELVLDPRAAAYAVGIAAVSAAVFGLLPAARLVNADPAAGLRLAGRSGTGHASGRLRGALVASQLAVSLVLLVSSLLALESHRRLTDVDPGFRAAGVVSFRVALAGPHYRTPESRRDFFGRVEEAVGRLPGVESVGVGSRVPFVPGSSGNGASIFVVGRAPAPDADQPLADVVWVSPGLLPTLGVPVTRGRPLLPSDDHRSGPVALVNRAAAAMLWPDSSPLGARLRTGTTGDAELRVVGVTGDVRFSSLRDPASPQVFVPAAQFPPARQTFAIRTDRAAAALAPELRRAVTGVDSGQPVFGLGALEGDVARSLATPKLTTRGLSVLAVLSAAMAAVGVYAVVAFTVGVRTREFGVRRALGARPRDVVGLVLREGAVTVALGLGVGLGGALLAARVLSSHLFGVSAIEPALYCGAMLALGLLALGAAVVPASRAARAHPARVLRGL